MANGWRIAATGDLHIGIRDEELQRVFRWIVKDAVAAGASLLSISGDVWDAAPTWEERHLAADLVREAADHMPVVVVRGNHDREGEVALLGKLRARHPILAVERPGVFWLPRDRGAFVPLDPDGASPPDDALVICALPWPRKAALAAAAAGGRSIGVEEAAALAADGLLQALTWFRLACASHAGPSLHVAHGQTTAARTGTGQPICGVDMELSPADFADVGASFTHLGHVHMHQFVFTNEDGSSGAYASSPRRTDYGEMDEKGYMLVDVRAAAPGVPRSLHAFRKTPCAPMYRLDGLFDAAASTLSLAPDPDTLALGGADVRIAYACPPDARREAARAAEKARQAIYGAGARHVRIAPPEAREARARRAGAVEARAARSTAAKVIALWEARRDPILSEPARRAEALALLAEWEEAAGIRPTGAPSLAVRIDEIAARGVGPFRDEIRLDLAALGRGRLVALSGPNGEGKSFLLGVPHVCMYGAFADRNRAGALKNWVGSRDAFAETRLAVGEDAWMLRIRCDPDRQTEGEAIGPDGMSGGIAAYKDWAARRFPPREAYDASMFAAQRPPLEYDLIDASPAQRKDAVVAMLGAAHLEALAEWGRKAIRRAPRRDERDATGLDPDEANARRAAEEAIREVERFEGAEAQAAEARRIAEAQAAEAQDAEDAEAAAMEAMAAWREQDTALRTAWSAGNERVRAADRAASEASEVAQRAEAAAETAQRRLREAGAAVAQAAVAGHKAAALPMARAAHEAASQRARAAHEAKVAATGQATATRERAAAAAKEAKAQEQWLVHGPTGLAPDADLAAERQRAGDLTEAETKSRDEAEDRERAAAEAAREARAAAEEAGRASHAAALLGRVPFGAGCAEAGCEFVADAAAAERGLPALVEAARAAEEAARAVREAPFPDWFVPKAEWGAGARLWTAILREQARRAAEASRAAAIAAAEAAIDAAAAATRAAAADDEEVRLREIVAEAESAAAAIVAAERARDRAADDQRAADEAAATAAEARRRATDVAEAARAARSALEATTKMGVAHKEAKPVDPESVRQRARAVRGVAAAAEERARVAEARIAEAVAARARATEAREAHARAEARLRAARLLVEALGRDGVQALEIDAAAPGIAEIANALLAAAWDGRFVVDIETTFANVNGRRQVDGLRIPCEDHEKGTTGDVSRLSGGELVVVGEALRLAVYLYGARQAGAIGGTLVRDESGAALSPENGRRYARLLREALRIGSLDQILFVHHDPAVRALADDEVRIAGGRCRLVPPGTPTDGDAREAA